MPSVAKASAFVTRAPLPAPRLRAVTVRASRIRVNAKIGDQPGNNAETSKPEQGSFGVSYAHDPVSCWLSFFLHIGPGRQSHAFLCHIFYVMYCRRRP